MTAELARPDGLAQQGWGGVGAGPPMSVYRPGPDRLALAALQATHRYTILPETARLVCIQRPAVCAASALCAEIKLHRRAGSSRQPAPDRYRPDPRTDNERGRRCYYTL